MEPITIPISTFHKVNVSVNVITLGSFDPLQVNLVPIQGTTEKSHVYKFDTQMFFQTSL